MVFIGPKSREDMGFTHSYDVFVDSYESDEDISDWSNYKMAGRVCSLPLLNPSSSLDFQLDGPPHALHHPHNSTVFD